MTVKKADQLVWICDACHRPIANGKGAVFVRYSERKAYRDGQVELKRKGKVVGPKRGRHLVLTSLADLMEAADPAPWWAMHHKCDPTPGDCAYWFDVARIRTVLDVLRWTHHLLEKNWLGETDWRDLIGGVVYSPTNQSAKASGGNA